MLKPLINTKLHWKQPKSKKIKV